LMLLLLQCFVFMIAIKSHRIAAPTPKTLPINQTEGGEANVGVKVRKTATD